MEFFSENLQSENSGDDGHKFTVAKIPEEKLEKLALSVWLLFSNGFLSERDRMTGTGVDEEQTMTRSKDVVGYINSLETFHGEVLKSIRSAVESGSSVLKEVRDLRDFIAHISNSVKNINDIAERVHVLSLNAAIEAARAGERGKGFAVVSSEIRNLAGSTAQRVDEISEYIRQSASTVDRVVEGIQSTVNTVSSTHHQMDTAKEQIKTVETIAGKVHDEVSKSHIIHMVNTLRADHAALRVSVYQSLMKGEALSEEKIPNAHNCVLGRWYRENKGLSAFSDLNVYQQLEGPHERFHDSIDGIRQAINMEDADEVAKNIELLETASSEISTILLDVVRGIE